MQPFVISNSDEVQAPTRLFTVVYGQPGVGKTSLCFTMPAPVLHLDFDQGVHRALQASGHKTVSISEYKGFRQWLFSPDFPDFVQNEGIRSIALDTIGTLLDDFIAPYLCELNPKNGSGGSLSLQGWGAMSIEFGAVKARLLSVGTELIATAHEKEEGDGDARQVRIAVKGGSSDIIYRSCDLLGYLAMRGNRRMLDFNPTQMHVGKNVAGLPSLEVPDETQKTYSSFMAHAVIEVAMNKIAERNARRLEVEAKLKAYRDEIAGLKTPVDFDAFSAGMKLEASTAVITQVKAMMGARMVEVGVTFEKGSGQFTWKEAPQGDDRGAESDEKQSGDGQPAEEEKPAKTAEKASK